MELACEMEPGEGRPLVFLHGWLGSKESWRQVRQHLELDNPILFYDHRCHGESPCEPFDFGDLAADLHTLIDEHGFEEPVLVGHSMGGMVALTYAVTYDNLGGLFLSGTCAVTPTPEVHSPSWFLQRFDEMGREEWADLIVENYFPGDRYDRLKAGARDEILDAAETPVTCGLEAMIDYDVRDDLSRLDIPAAVVGAEQDHAITGDRVRELAELLDCTEQMVDTCHLIPEAEPRRYADLLSDFLDREGLATQ
ncbi:MAG: alpha/beta hydrolase [Candidatus Nanohaloarchaea archaeon]|nr:alpha/beta hydrolase [Candidatus Nanohaloarchaea archaeon]